MKRKIFDAATKKKKPISIKVYFSEAIVQLHVKRRRIFKKKKMITYAEMRLALVKN